MNAAAASPAPIALWRLLQSAAGVLRAVREGISATPVLAAVPAELRAGTQALAFQALRHLGRAEALRAQLAKRPPHPAADALLCTALALCWDPAQAPYEPFTLVNQAVEAAKRQKATTQQANFINACLRRFLRERDELVAATDGQPVAQWNHPYARDVGAASASSRAHAKYWPPVGRVDNVYGDRNLFCSCVPVSELA